MHIKDLIALADIFAPSAYAKMRKTDWGVLFWDENNPTKHDINHACILEDSLFAKALPEIRDFYINKDLTPRIYLLKNQKDTFQADLFASGFETYTVGDFKHFLLTDENRIPQSHQLDIRELTERTCVTQELLHNLYDVYMQDDSDTLNRMQRMLPCCIESKKCNVWCGYFEGRPVCLAMVVTSDFGMQFFDLVETAEQYQCRGFARELISFLVNRAKMPTFLYSENPTAIRIYEQAGFREISVEKDAVYWRAVYTEER